MKRILVPLLFFVAACWLLSSSLFGQIVVDTYDARNDDERLEMALRAANELHNTTHNNRTVTLTFAPRVYRFYNRDGEGVFKDVPGQVSFVSEGSGRRATTFAFINPVSGDSLLRFRNSYGTVVQGILVTTNRADHARNVRGIALSSLSSCRLTDFEVNLIACGPNSDGVYIERNGMYSESCLVENGNITASRGVYIRNADNLLIRNMDITLTRCTVDNGEVAAAFLMGPGSKPDAVSIQNCSTQGGSYFFYLDSTVQAVGSGLSIRDCRAEQLAQDDEPVILIDPKRYFTSNGERVHGLEYVTISGFRNSRKPNCLRIEGVLKVDARPEANFFQGTRVINSYRDPVIEPGDVSPEIVEPAVDDNRPAVDSIPMFEEGGDR